MDDEVLVSPATVGVEGSSMYLVAGEVLTVRELLYGVLLKSGNDAALTLAVHVGGSEADFVTMMNARARSLGLTDTSFENPHGLDGEHHYTTARELGYITAEMLQNEELAAIVATRNMMVAGRSLANSNRLLRQYDGADGVKTGFTRRSGRCLVSSATRDGTKLIAVTLNAPNDWNDHTRMLNYGFNTYSLREFAAGNTAFVNIPVIGGDWPNVDLIFENRLAFALTNEEYGAYLVRMEAPRFVFAPVNDWDVAGWAIVYEDGIEVARTALRFDMGIEQESIQRESLWRRFVRWLRGE